MSGWKNRLQRTIGINTAVAHAEQTNHLYNKMITDLEGKNSTLHRCTFTAYSGLEKIIENCDAKEATVGKIQGELTELKSRMKEILENGNNAKPALEHADNPKRLITE